MELKDFKFELNDKQKKARQELVEALRVNPTIIRFMERYNCPFEVVEENVFRFRDWLIELDRINRLSESELSENPDLGGYVNLYYDDKQKVLLDEYKVLPMAQRIQDESAYLDAYRIFPLNKSLQVASFENVNLDRENLEYISAYNTLIKFADNEELGHYLYGDLGVGKSFLAACLTNHVAKRGQSVAFVSVSDLLSHLKKHFGQVDYTLDVLKGVEFLVIDDLGAEPISAWGRDEVLLPLLNSRLENFRKTLFTSNYPMDMLEEVYSLDSRGGVDKLRSKRFVDRILAISSPLEIVGENRRHLCAKNNKKVL